MKIDIVLEDLAGRRGTGTDREFIVFFLHRFASQVKQVMNMKNRSTNRLSQARKLIDVYKMFSDFRFYLDVSK